jgi:hypothetical protein
LENLLWSICIQYYLRFTVFLLSGPRTAVSVQSLCSMNL